MNVAPGVSLIIAGILGVVLGPMLGFIRTFVRIEAMSNSSVEDLRTGMATSLLWGLPGLILLIVGIFLTRASLRRRHKESQEK